MLTDKPTLDSFSYDFGRLIESYPQAVCAPARLEDAVSLIKFAYSEKLPLSIRGNGLSQSGQIITSPRWINS